jgi:hypothetical protein
LWAQEKPVPKDSTRLSAAGCARGRLFIVDVNPEHESRSIDLQPGSRLRLEGPKKLLDEIKANESSMIEITGLIKKSDMVQPGVGVAGGRVRITPVMPSGPTGRDAGMMQPVFDLESWRLLLISCPAR